MTRRTNGWHRQNRQSPAAKQRRRDYNTRDYRRAGEAARQQVAQGQAHCWRCHRHIPPTAKRGPDWVVGHDDHNRTIIRGVECTPCNKHAASIIGNHKRQTLYPHLNWTHKTKPIRPHAL